MRVAVILLAAGSGRRYAESSGSKISKQFVQIGGVPVICHALKAFLPHVDVVQPVGDVQTLDKLFKDFDVLPPVKGGETRQGSVRQGLEALSRLPKEKQIDVVLVHDGARPYVPASLIKRVIEALHKAPGAVPAVAVADTLKRGKDGFVDATIPRENLYRAQTPQAFHYQLFLDVHRQAKMDATDDTALMEEAGFDVAIVKGDEDNIKLTYEADLVRLERVLGPTLLPRVGLGYDVHAFAKKEEDRPLYICGVKIEHERGLKGHSDADVGIHALCDAIYGAISEGDIGHHFPPSQQQWKDAKSTKFLEHAAQRVRSRGGVLVNVDLTIICERPKIGPHVNKMRDCLSDLLKIDKDRISVKATTTEHLGFTGREEGIASIANATVLLP